jgi:Bacterial PH domain/Short C-terminal domain
MARFDKLLDRLTEHLEEGEMVLESVLGAYETKIAGTTGLFAATDRRLVFYAKKLTGYEIEVFPYDHISSFEAGKSMMGHSITFFASGNKAKMKWIKRADATKFVETVKARLGKQAASQPPATEAQKDVIAEIRRLASLRDEGLLTEQEFQEQKARLLNA